MRSLIPAVRLALLGAALLALRSSAALALEPDGIELQGVAAKNYARHEPPEVRTVALHRPWIWSAEKGGTKLWLAGCLHMGADPDPATFPAYLPYYERASAVYFEVTPSSWQNPDVVTIMGRRGYPADRRPLSGAVSAGIWQEACSVLQFQPELLGRIRPMEPWLASLTVAQEAYRRAGLQRGASLESYIERKAAVDRKPVCGLERAQDQIYAMADAKRADQERSFQDALDNYGKPDAGSGHLRRAWRGGDEKAMRDAFGTRASDDEMHANLLPKRNVSWVRKIDTIVEAGRPVLIVVGVEHLLSEPQSLVSLLRGAGFRVERVGSGGENRETEASPPPRPAPPKVASTGDGGSVKKAKE